MAVRLQTADGKIKKYDTIYTEGKSDIPYGEGDLCRCKCHIRKCATKCGLEWKINPENDTEIIGLSVQPEDCDHVDCAIYVAERDHKDYSHPFVIILTVIVFVFELIIFQPWRDTLGLILFGLFLPLQIGFLLEVYKAGKRLNELKEYKQWGTINGMKAYKINDDL